MDEQGRPKDPPPYVVDTIRCQVCAAKESEMDRAGKANSAQGLKVFARPSKPEDFIPVNMTSEDEDWSQGDGWDRGTTFS